VVWNLILCRSKATIPNTFLNSKNIFIYFDYEREYSGQNPSISDDDIEYILKLLEEQSINSTWFTVGKLFEEYPDSIAQIQESGHEIGSHTYSHIPPIEVSMKKLKADFHTFSTKSQSFSEVKGFHSPKGRWSYRMLRYLRKYDFQYDLIGARKPIKYLPYFICFGGNKILRLITIGDDWNLYNKKFQPEEICEYLVKQISQINPGEVAGIGFHPWILFSDKNILLGFSKFLNYLSKQDNVRLESAFFYAQSMK